MIFLLDEVHNIYALFTLIQNFVMSNNIITNVGGHWVQ